MNRVKNIQKLLEKHSLFGCFLQTKENLFYATQEHISEGLLLITQKEAHLFIDGRYFEQMKEKLPSFHIHLITAISDISEKLSPFKGETIVFDPSMVPVSLYKILHKALGKNLIENESFFRVIRRKKDLHEITAIEKASHLCEEGFLFLLRNIKKGVSEKELSQKLKSFWLDHGGEAISFEPIIAFGKNSAYPHWSTSDTRLEANEIILIDIGVSLDSYHSDMTRMVFFKKPDEELLKCHQIVQEAYELAKKAAKPHVNPHDIDTIARNYIQDKGYKEAFCHGLGHGVGLEIHEPPRLNQKLKNEQPLENGDVFTIEPGIYLPGKGGIRLENTLVLENDVTRSFMKTPISPYFV